MALESVIILLCEYMGELHEAPEKGNEHPEENENWTGCKSFDCPQAGEGCAQDQSLPAAGSLSFRLSLRAEIRLRVHVEGLTFKFYEISTSKSSPVFKEKAFLIF